MAQRRRWGFFAIVASIVVAAAAATRSGQQSAQAAADSLCRRAAEESKAKRVTEAVASATECVAAFEAIAGPESPQLVEPLKLLGQLQITGRNFAGAATSFAREVTIREKAPDGGGNDLVTALLYLATARRSLNQLTEAVDVMRRAVAVREKVPGDPPLLSLLNNLSIVEIQLGDLPAASATLARAVKIFESQKGELDRAGQNGYALILSRLADLYSAQDTPAKSVAPAQESLALRERLSADPSTDAAVATGAANLAGFYQALADFERAEPLYQRAFEIYARAKDAPLLNVARAKNGLAMMRLLQKRFAEAEPLYAEALQLMESALGSQHTAVAQTLESTAVFYAVTNRREDALRAMARATEIHEQVLRSILVQESDAGARNYMTTVQENTEIALSLRGRFLADSEAAAKWAAALTLQRKGRVLDASVALSRRFGDSGPEEQARIAELTQKLGAFASAAQQVSAVAPGQREQELKRLQSEIASLQSTLARSAGATAALGAVDLAAVQRQLPAATALVEYVQYRPFDPNVRGQLNRFGPARYAIFVLKSTGAPRWVELGEAAPIDAQVHAFRKALATRDPGIRPAARALTRAILDPIEADLAGITRLLIAPDSELSVIPFAALSDAKNQFLIQRFELSYLTSGRDLLRLADRLPARASSLIVADPAFQGAAGAAGFAPLPGTAGEATAVHALLPDSRVFVGAAATESVIKSAKGPRILHIATHGYFTLPGTLQTAGAASSQRGIKTGPATAASQPLDPFSLLRSGLAFAGANTLDGGNGENGLLSALEAANLDLHGAQLVVLSACETGLGQVQSGNGVYGLRRAFEIAGAESQVMSLWKVNDLATRDLMIAFYKQLTAGSGRAASLRAVQLDLLKSRERSHPYYWASFITAGDWTPLRN
jgi:CHAT domain-containing protein/tetratricopeptide (TPR) repeat protein